MSNLKATKTITKAAPKQTVIKKTTRVVPKASKSVRKLVVQQSIKKKVYEECMAKLEENPDYLEECSECGWEQPSVDVPFESHECTLKPKEAERYLRVMDWGLFNTHKLVFDEEKYEITLFSDRTNAKDEFTDLSNFMEPLFPEGRGYVALEKEEYDQWRAKVMTFAKEKNISVRFVPHEFY